MDKRDVIKISSVILIVLIILIGLIILIIPEEKAIEPYYNQEPGSWIQETPENKVKIDVDEFSEEHARMDPTSEQFFTEDGEIFGFFHKGWYKGEYFTKQYIDPAYKEQTTGKNSEEILKIQERYTKMKIHYEMVPNDGIIEGTILAKLENDKFVFYAFVDEDWKTSLPITNVICGQSLYENIKAAINKFQFINQKNGIYIHKIDCDTSWRESSGIQEGGVIIGDITLDNLRNKNLEGKTFIMVN